MCQAGILFLPEALSNSTQHMLCVEGYCTQWEVCLSTCPLGQNTADNINLQEVGKIATSRIHSSQAFLPIP